MSTSNVEMIGELPVFFISSRKRNACGSFTEERLGISKSDGESVTLLSRVTSLGQQNE